MTEPAERKRNAIFVLGDLTKSSQRHSADPTLVKFCFPHFGTPEKRFRGSNHRDKTGGWQKAESRVEKRELVGFLTCPGCHCWGMLSQDAPSGALLWRELQIASGNKTLRTWQPGWSFFEQPLLPSQFLPITTMFPSSNPENLHLINHVMWGVPSILRSI